MKNAADFIGMKGHLVGFREQKLIYGPGDQLLLRTIMIFVGDIEAHKGSDGRYYVLDAARCFPPEVKRIRSRLSNFRHLLNPSLV